MTMMAPAVPDGPAERQPFMLRIADYELLDRAGGFRGRPVELIGGRLVAVNAQLQAHAAVRSRLGRRLQEALDACRLTRIEVITEGTLALSANDLPDPDVMVASVTAARDYFRVHQVALVIEVADTSLRYDLGDKRDLYAQGSVPEYWVVDINARQVHRFWRPVDGVYEAEPPIPLAGPLASLTMPELVVDGGGIL